MTLVVQVPTGLSTEAKDALRKFDELSVNSLQSSGKGTGSGKKAKKKSFADKIKDAFEDI